MKRLILITMIAILMVCILAAQAVDYISFNVKMTTPNYVLLCEALDIVYPQPSDPNEIANLTITQWRRRAFYKMTRDFVKETLSRKDRHDLYSSYEPRVIPEDDFMEDQ